MFMRYVRTEDDPVRKAAELVASRRKGDHRGTAGGRGAGVKARPYMPDSVWQIRLLRIVATASRQFECHNGTAVVDFHVAQ